MKSAACIGMLDWGIGGIECYRLFKQAHPEVPVLYWSDTGATPYGRMSKKALSERVAHVVNRLVQRGATRIIFACNAAATVLPSLRTDVPCTGVIEHAARAIPADFRGVLGIVGGARTIRSGQHRRALRARPGLQVVTRIAQPLSAHIEAGSTDTDGYRHDLRSIMAPLARVDGLLLACTHYAAVKADLRALLSDGAQLFDPVPALVDFVSREWPLPTSEMPDQFVTTGDPVAMQQAASRVWGVPLLRCGRG